MSNAERPEFLALGELETVTEQLATELASLRRRALKAEAAQADMSGDLDAVATRAKILELEAENRDLRGRLDAAKQRVAELLARLHFLEEQMAASEVSR